VAALLPMASWWPAVALLCNISDFGAVSDNRTVNTRAFQRAVAHCGSGAAPGRRAVVHVPAGVWLTGAFNLTSHLTLELARGAIITGSLDPRDYPQLAVFPSYGKCNDGS
jgi:polygalacturonase